MFVKVLIDLNLLGVETLVNDKSAALEKIREDVFMDGFMIDAQRDYPTENLRLIGPPLRLGQRVTCRP